MITFLNSNSWFRGINCMSVSKCYFMARECLFLILENYFLYNLPFFSRFYRNKNDIIHTSEDQQIK